jgi:hypothetical protein
MEMHPLQEEISPSKPHFKLIMRKFADIRKVKKLNWLKKFKHIAKANRSSTVKDNLHFSLYIRGV